MVHVGGVHVWRIRGSGEGIKYHPWSFFRLEMAYSSAFLMHTACNGGMLIPQTGQICLTLTPLYYSLGNAPVPLYQGRTQNF